MISFLRGSLVRTGAQTVVLEVGGVGYELVVPTSTLARAPAPGETTTLYTHLQVREDSLVLFGFASPAECQLFRLLLGVTGIGSRAALGILSATTPERFLMAVAFEDVAALTRLPGVGKKTAQRLILELRERIGYPLADVVAGQAPAAAPAHGPAEEAAEALVALGYPRSEAAEAVRRARAELGPDANAKALVRHGLKHLARVE